MKYPTLDDIQVDGKTVLVRVDFNVSLNDKCEIRDDARIQASLPTLRELRRKGAKLVLMSHLGRPKGKRVEKYSLVPVGARLAELLECEVIVPQDSVGMEVQQLVKTSKPEQVVLLENLRFHPEEEKNDEIFAEKLAKIADVFVNDAFGVLHRSHASTVGVVKHFAEKAIGRLVEKEVDVLSRLLFEPQRPYTVVLGGAKVSDKIDVIENLLNCADKILVGGGMAYTFLKAQGVSVGKSLVEDSKLGLAKRLLQRAATKGVEFVLPEDSIIAEEFSESANYRVANNSEDWGTWMGLDIGPKTVEAFQNELVGSHTVFWNGPMGVYEMESFQNGTNQVAASLSNLPNALTVVGGGDSLAAVNGNENSKKQISHLSTGGGASLTFLEGKELPGLKVLL